jgi:hypothetical protein
VDVQYAAVDLPGPHIHINKVQDVTHSSQLPPSPLSPPHSSMASSLPPNGLPPANAIRPPHAQATDILQKDAAKAKVPVHSFHPDASPAEKAAVAGQAATQLSGTPTASGSANDVARGTPLSTFGLHDCTESFSSYLQSSLSTLVAMALFQPSPSKMLTRNRRKMHLSFQVTCLPQRHLRYPTGTESAGLHLQRPRYFRKMRTRSSFV